ncbi:hypothetical protein BDR03DRAFT_102818 [Suillus americanus]|nr:hypothetical protein BDR03DRAFT_102818 [Suillus americanus]
MTIKFPVHDPRAVVPLGWTTLVHPEGSRYFLNEKKRTFTEVDIFDLQIHRRIETHMQYLWSGLESIVRREKHDLDMTQVDLVLELKEDDKPASSATVCCYYFVNHNSRCLFWLHESDVKDVLSGCKGVESLSHIRGWIVVVSVSGSDDLSWFSSPGLAIQAQYWLHWEYFPNLCVVSQDHVDEVKDTLMHATCDHMTSKRSSALGDVIELKDYISVVDGIKVHSPENQQMQRCHAAIIIGRIMKLFSDNQFINFHGENCVRLIADKTVHGWAYTPSLLMVVVAPLLFLDPVTQVQELHRVFVDEIASTARWNALSSKLKGRLQDSNLLATVLLNANVGFLAINSVDRGGRSAIQMASYMSLATSFGSIILGIFLVWHEQTSGDNTAMEAATFALRLHDKKHGLESLAVIYSVPKALFMWGMIFFFVAFSIDWFGAGDTTSRAVVGAVILIVFTMILNGIIRVREGEGWWWRAIGQQLSSLPACAWKRVVEFVKMKRGQRCEPQPDPEEASLHTLTRLSQANVEADASTSRNFQPETSGVDGHEDHSRSSIPRTRSDQPNASVASRNEGQTTAVTNDTGTAISPSSYYTEHEENARYTDNIVEEPEEVDYPRPSPSTTPHPRIVARSATDEPFRHAPVPAKWTLQDGQDIEECKDRT